MELGFSKGGRHHDIPRRPGDRSIAAMAKDRIGWRKRVSDWTPEKNKLKNFKRLEKLRV